MEIINYVSLRDGGFAKLQQLGPGAFQVVAKQFDRATGAELAPEIANFGRATLSDMRANVQKTLAEKTAELAALDALGADMDKLESK